MSIKAIETRYAGHLFRSRLEARWAVFFDHLGIRWQYETEGFELGARMSNNCFDLRGDEPPITPTSYRYLPDFWLPDHHLWVEVKGQFSDAALLKTLDCLAALSCNGGGGRHDSGGHDSIVLGPMPRNEHFAPVGLCMNKGLLQATPWKGQSGCLTDYSDSTRIIAGDYGGSLRDIIHGAGEMSVEEVRDLLTYGYVSHSPTAKWAAALAAARTARFEHGDKPENAKPYSNSRVPTQCQNERCVNGRLYDLPNQWSFRFCQDPAHTAGSTE